MPKNDRHASPSIVIMGAVIAIGLASTLPGVTNSQKTTGTQGLQQIEDGDTFKHSGTWYRLYAIDTPEPWQDGYHKARRELAHWLKVHSELKPCNKLDKTGRYGRALIHCPEIEARLVEKGLAKQYHEIKNRETKQDDTKR